MGDLLLQGIDDALEHQLHESARRNGRSLSDEAKDILGRAIAPEGPEKPDGYVSAFDAIRSIFEEEDGLSDEFAAIMDEIEADRKKDFGRPVEDLE